MQYTLFNAVMVRIIPGLQNDLDRRLWEHETGFNTTCYTFKRRPVILKYYEVTIDVKQAILREKQLKGWSRAKKEALFEENWEEIQRLSKIKRDRCK
jgi:putative endonuclease